VDDPVLRSLRMDLRLAEAMLEKHRSNSMVKAVKERIRELEEKIRELEAERR